MVASVTFRPCHVVGITLLTAALGLSGCFLGRKGPALGPASTGVELQVINHNWLDVRVYVIHDGQRTRVGLAGGSANTEMVLPWRLLGVGRDIQLYGDPIGSSEKAITEVISVQPGQFIEWLLESGLDRSTVGVY